jgi:hypothetical protein
MTGDGRLDALSRSCDAMCHGNRLSLHERPTALASSIVRSLQLKHLMSLHMRSSANFRRGVFHARGMSGACPSIYPVAQSCEPRALEDPACHSATIDIPEMYRGGLVTLMTACADV